MNLRSIVSLTSDQFETVLLMVAVAVACAIPGVFLVLRKVVLVADAISHVLLLGIVLAYFLVRDAASPLLLLGGAAVGVLTVAIVELLRQTGRVKEDAAIGLVFPALFSMGVILASMYLRNTHLDVDRVLLGSAELAPLDRMTFFGRDIGPKSLIVMLVCIVLTVGCLSLFYKELKLTTFDPGLAATLGFAPVIVHYLLMTSVSLTTVAAFDAVGPVLVLAFFAVPSAAATLLSDRLSRVLIISVTFAALVSITGTILAIRLDTNFAGTVSACLGLVFILTLLLSPSRGMIATTIRRAQQRREFLETMLTIHLLSHETTIMEADEANRARLHVHLGWTPGDTEKVALRAERLGLIQLEGEIWKLTEKGRMRAQSALP